MSSLRTFFVFTIVSLSTFAPPAAAVTSAELYRPESLGFGKFEARVQFAAGDGVISSFFLWKDGSERAEVYWNELDFEKLGADCDLQTNSIFGLPQRTSEEEGYGLEGLCEGYHTYSYEWTPDYIAWFVDGVEIRRDTGEGALAYAENATRGMQFRFNVWPGNANFGGNFDESILPVYQFVSWAQYSEYTPGVGDDGSDFTFSWREEFDSVAPSGWLKGSWDSPFGLSDHSVTNVAFVDGIAVLALTADGARGYRGSPPPDGASSASAGEGGAGGSSEGAGGTGGSPTQGTVPPRIPQSGCSISARSSSRRLGGASGTGGLALVLVLGLGAHARRSRARSV